MLTLPLLESILIELLGLDAGTSIKETDTLHALGGDSLDLVEMLMAAEEALKVDLGTDELGLTTAATCAEIVAAVNAKIAATA